MKFLIAIFLLGILSSCVQNDPWIDPMMNASMVGHGRTMASMPPTPSAEGLAKLKAINVPPR